MKLDDQARLLASVALLWFSIAILLAVGGCGKLPTEDPTCKTYKLPLVNSSTGDTLGWGEITLCGGATLAGATPV